MCLMCCASLFGHTVKSCKIKLWISQHFWLGPCVVHGLIQRIIECWTQKCFSNIESNLGLMTGEYHRASRGACGVQGWFVPGRVRVVKASELRSWGWWWRYMGDNEYAGRVKMKVMEVIILVSTEHTCWPSVPPSLLSLFLKMTRSRGLRAWQSPHLTERHISYRHCSGWDGSIGVISSITSVKINGIQIPGKFPACLVFCLRYLTLKSALCALSPPGCAP